MTVVRLAAIAACRGDTLVDDVPSTLSRIAMISAFVNTFKIPELRTACFSRW